MEKMNEWKPLKGLGAVLLVAVVFFIALAIKPVFALALLCIALYVTPAIIARANKKRNAGAICALNILTGWTVIGWVIALVWSFTVDVKA